MTPRRASLIRWFVGVTLILGAFVLVGGAIQYGTLAGAPSWVVPLSGIVAALLAIITVIEESGPRSPMGPAALWIASVLLAILWSTLDSAGPGHAFLSGYAAVVAFATGIGIVRRQLWARPVALASVVGFGPIVLVIARLPAATVAGGFVLFLMDVVGLLAIHRSYYEPRR